MKNLKIIVQELCFLNQVYDFDFNALSELNKDYDMAKLDAQAKIMREDVDVKIEFLDGEVDRINELTEFYGVEYLSSYLDKVYDTMF